MIWDRDPDAKAYVLDLAKDGDSAGIISAKLYQKHGLHVTRNAIIGLVHRNGGRLKGPQNYNRLRKILPRRPKQKRIASIQGMYAARQSAKPPAFCTAPLPFPQPEDIPHISFLDLEDHHCRYPCLPETAPPDAPQFCGMPKITGSSYCKHHAAVCGGLPLPKPKIERPQPGRILVNTAGAVAFESA